MSKDEKSNYYDKGGLETIDIIKAKLTQEQYIGYLLGNAIKYACRLNFKGSAERDAEKLANYSRWVAGQDLQDEIITKRMVEYPSPCTCFDCDRDYISDISKHHG